MSKINVTYQRVIQVSLTGIGEDSPLYRFSDKGVLPLSTEAAETEKEARQACLEYYLKEVSDGTKALEALGTMQGNRTAEEVLRDLPFKREQMTLHIDRCEAICKAFYQEKEPVFPKPKTVKRDDFLLMLYQERLFTLDTIATKQAKGLDTTYQQGQLDFANWLLDRLDPQPEAAPAESK